MEFEETRLKAMKAGIAYYDCPQCGNRADVCGHACIKQGQQMVRLCGEVPTQEWKNLGNNPTQQQIEKDWANRQPPAPPPPPPPPANLIIGIPTAQQQDAEWSSYFALTFIPRLCPPNSGVIFENRYGIAQSRESIVNTFIKNPVATHLLFYDTDIMPIDTHAITTLVNDTLSDPRNYIVSGCYYNSLYTGLAAWINDIALNFKDPNNIVNTSKDPLIEVDKVGMGLCMIRKDLFKLLVMEDRPLFYYKILEGNVMQSEDFVFFDKLAKYNVKPFIDTRVKATHIKRCKIGYDGGVGF